MRTFFLRGAKYFISFIDDYSRYTYVYHLKKKSKAFVMFQAYKALVEKQNDEEEYSSLAFKAFCIAQGILHQFIISYTPKANVIVEKKN